MTHFVLLLLAGSAMLCVNAEYLVGIGKADITGPVADVNLMGYAMPLQISRGIHTRLYARAFIVAGSKDNRRRFVYVVSDACMESQLVTLRVLARLQVEYGGLYNADNVVLSGTHTHASPAGFLQYVLYSITSLGFVQQSFDALVDGISEAVRFAHEDLAPADVSWASGELQGANINRSPTAYLANPADERAKYAWDVDKDMDILRIKHPATTAAATGVRLATGPANMLGAVAGDNAAGTQDGSLVGQKTTEDDGRGLISWFPVHCTSMNNTNPFVSGDNKGAAAGILEKEWQIRATVDQKRSHTKHEADMGAGSTRHQPGDIVQWSRCRQWLSQLSAWLIGGLKGNPASRLEDRLSLHDQTSADATSGAGVRQGFTAAFAQSSVGDTSPNVLGAYCLDTGEPCVMSSSTCGGRNELCHGRGPAWPDDTASTAIIGQLQADKAKELWQADGTAVSGDVDYRHVYINMSNYQVSGSKWTRAGVTCAPAMGFSFAAGTTDGPGAFDFTQGDVNGSSPFWRIVRDFISPPSPEQQACHAPKPILLNTGYIKLPYPWQPAITEMSVLRLGNIVIIAVPGEFTTMAGRRIKLAVAETVGHAWGEHLKVVLSGLSGTYSSYITTWEEYQVQRYEGASTIYGPHTLDAYIQTAVQLVQAMLAGKPLHSSVAPPDLRAEQIELLGPVVRDAVPGGTHFGDVVVQPLPAYLPGQTAEAVFRSGCPRNNLRRNSTFMAVQLQAPDGNWSAVVYDNDWSTHFYWERHWKLAAYSFATLRWAIPADAAPGTYRLTHYGDWKPLFGTARPFQGSSNTFVVTTNATVHRQLLAQAASAGVQSHPQGGATLLAHWQSYGLDPVTMLVCGNHISVAGGEVQPCNDKFPMAGASPRHDSWNRLCTSHCVQMATEVTEKHNTGGAYSRPLARVQDRSVMTLEQRWSALQSLHQSSVHAQTRLSSGHWYVAWWRGEALCSRQPLSSELLKGYCTYGPA